MQQWEYKVVTVTILDIGDAIKHRGKRAQIDANFSDTEWMRRTVKVGRQDIARVAWSDRGCWTSYSTCLQELGEAGWELVGTTPALTQYSASGAVERNEVRYPDFWLNFKRPLA